VLDLGLSTGNSDFGFNEALFDNSDSEWWNIYTFWAYNFLIVGILQIIKGFQEE
jgi:hypothetical protein